MDKMFKHENKSCIMCVLFVLLLQMNFQAAEQSEIHEKIKYHLTELRRGMLELRTSHSRLHKRSVRLDHNEMIYSSLVAFCSQLTSNNVSDSKSSTHVKNTSMVTSTASQNDYQKSLANIVHPEKEVINIDEITPISTWPYLFPLRVQAERDGDRVWLVFDVIHTAPALLARYNSFDYQKVFIDYPDHVSHLPVKSVVRVSVEASICVKEPIGYDDEDANIGFSLQGASPYYLTTIVDLCMFDKVWNDTADNGAGKWETKEEKITNESIPLTHMMKIVSPADFIGSEIVVQKGQDVTLVLDLHLMGSSSSINIQVYLWNRRQKGKILKQTRIISYINGNFTVHPAHGQVEDENKLLSVDILNTTLKPVHPRTDGESDQETIIRAMVKITVRTSIGKISGRLLMTYFNHRHNYYNRRVVRSIISEREIKLKLPHRGHALPKNTAQIITNNERPLECDKKGMRHHSKHGRNCTIYCHAYGTDLKRISIIEPTGVQLPVKSVSYVLSGGTLAFAMIDVGPASTSVEGIYKCKVTTHSGKTKKKGFKLYTSLFTNMTHASLFDFKNGTSRVICTASGAQPLNMSVSVSTENGDKNERIDNKTSTLRSITVVGNVKNMTLFVSTDLLRYPNTYLSCDASGERGGDGKMLTIGNYVSDHNPLMPKMNKMPNVSTIEDYLNGTVQISCAASGGKPLDFWLTYGGNAERYRIDNKPENLRIMNETAEGGILHLFVNKSTIIGGSSWIGCKAKNRFGSDWQDIYIYDYLGS